MQSILIHVYKKWDFDKANLSNSMIYKSPKLYFDLEYVNAQMATVINIPEVSITTASEEIPTKS